MCVSYTCVWSIMTQSALKSISLGLEHVLVTNKSSLIPLLFLQFSMLDWCQPTLRQVKRMERCLCVSASFELQKSSGI